MKNFSPLLKSFFVFSLLIASTASHAEELLMARVHLTFPEAMSKLQEVIKKQGYTLSRVQRVDIGLTKSGYKTDKYRVVFFGKAKEIDHVANKYPQLMPYIPWKMAIFAEQDNTLLVTSNPVKFIDKKFPGANKYLKRWEKDIQEILSTMRAHDNE